MENIEIKDVKENNIILKKNYIFEIIFTVLVLCGVYILFISNINHDVVFSVSFFIALVMIAFGWFGIANKKNKYVSYTAIFLGSLPILLVITYLLMIFIIFIKWIFSN